MQTILSWDDRLLMWVNGYMGKYPWLDALLRYLLDSNELKFGVMIAAFYWLWFRFENRKQGERAILALTALAGLSALFCARLLILALPFRSRPIARPELHFTLPADFETNMRVWSAFPSDHAVLAFTLATGCWLVSRRVGAWAFLHAALIICLPRFYFGLHHFTDLLGGALIGVAFAWLFTRKAICIPIAKKVLYFEQRYRGAFYLIFFLLLQQMVVMFSSLRTMVGMTLALLQGKY
jgi:undecaprenyl-diphosphatase